MVLHWSVCQGGREERRFAKRDTMQTGPQGAMARSAVRGMEMPSAPPSDGQSRTLRAVRAVASAAAVGTVALDAGGAVPGSRESMAVHRTSAAQAAACGNRVVRDARAAIAGGAASRQRFGGLTAIMAGLP